ncbi:MAG: hypothetical protein IK022_02825 [Bacteroidales bacterium]|nr:hypothetical protein [Bacteroidales bacterium]
MKRFNVIQESKFESMSEMDMSSTLGGQLCVSCKKRTRRVEIGIGDDDPLDHEIKIIDIKIH